MQKNLIIILILSIFISVFAILNAGAVAINLFFTTLEISVALVILISATIGAVIVFSLDTASKYKYRKTIRENEKNAEKLEKEKEELEEKIQWYETELAREREQNFESILDKDNGQDSKQGGDGAEKETPKNYQYETQEETQGKSRGLKDRWMHKKSPNNTTDTSEDKQM